MYNDVIDLRDFYNTPMGHTAQSLGRRHIRAIWPTVEGLNLAGIGYPTPYLRPFLGEAERVVALMPAQQGVVHWPADSKNEGRNIVSLVPEDDLPLGDLSMDRILLVHAIECSEQSHKLLREVWRVMAGGGKLLIVVPNRRGIWARMDHTPFGHGHPYTHRQVSRLLRDNLFQPGHSTAGLFVPPTRSRMALASARAIEQIGLRWFKTVGGLLFIEAQKQIYAGTLSTPTPARARPYAHILRDTKRGLIQAKKKDLFPVQ
ncbi:MAG: methyltransferase domain-containing protein [Pseudomonadota bacterium]|nr:methyltransferase domain-containing protein [Pseudomonadota bacterium]